MASMFPITVLFNTLLMGELCKHFPSIALHILNGHDFSYNKHAH